jgi:N-acetylglucosamine malate deacetylase 1
MTILVLAPHPDDEVLGVGGTLARYAAEGQRVVVVIFSSGEASHPLHKEHLVIRKRKEEAIAATKALGVTETIFFMLEDGNLREEIVEKDVIAKLYAIIEKEKPTKIFMPSLDDIHGDHRAVSDMMLQLYLQHSLMCSIYTYAVWNPLAILKRAQPRLVIDISPYQHQKLEAIREYKSQWVSLYQLVPVVLLKTFFSGIRYGHRWTEVFIQVR